MNVTPAKTDWFDDDAWARVANNFALAARIAKEGRYKGFMFDTEQYEGVTVFDYRRQKDKGTKTFAEYQAKVTSEASNGSRPVSEHYPNITLLLKFGYETSLWHAAKPKHRSTAASGLLADFLDGVLDGPKETVIVDDWEFSYPYKKRKR